MPKCLPIQLIVGLGNPGAQYEGNRHNVGAWLVSAIAEHYRADLRCESKFYGICATFQAADSDCKLLIPSTFMNCSGRAVQAVANFYKIPHESILVVHDELDFLPGIARFKFGGGHNGQKGVQDIIAALGSNEFHRFRIGIGRPQHKDIATYVLSNPPKEERIAIDGAIQRFLDVVPDVISGQIQKVMQLLH